MTHRHTTQTRHCPPWCVHHRDEVDADGRVTVHEALAVDTTSTEGTQIRVGLRRFDMRARIPRTAQLRETTVWVDAGHSDGGHQVEGLTLDEAAVVGRGLLAAADELATRPGGKHVDAGHSLRSVPVVAVVVVVGGALFVAGLLIGLGA